MDKKIENILADLYAIDPELRSYGPQLEKLVVALLKSKPDTQFDKAFAQRLRNELMDIAGAAARANQSGSTNTVIMKFQKFWYVGVAVLALIIAIPTLLFTQKNSETPIQLADGSIVTQRPAGAFGRLSLNESGLGSASAGAAVTEESAVGKVAGFGGGGGGVPSDISIMPYPYTVFTLQYGGDDIELAETELPVLRRTVDDVPSGSYGDLLTSLGFGAVDLTTLNNPQLLNLTFTEGIGGYSASVDLLTGLISMYRQDYHNEPYQPLSINNVPSDERLIEIADSFLAQRRIATSGYGEPIVQQEWRRWYEQAEGTSELYIPEIMTVVYPLEIEGRPVYDQGANPDGLMVGIDIRNNRVTSVYNIAAQRFESSLYDVETDIDTLIGIQNGQQFAPVGAEINEQFVTVGTPEFTLEKIYQFVDGMTIELFVPALRFPVIEKPKDHPYYSDYIMIPLVTELLNQYGGRIEPAG